MTALQTHFSELLNPCKALKAFQEKALEKLKLIGFPSPKDESYQYMNLNAILQTPFQKGELQKPDEEEISKWISHIEGPYLVIYKGHFLPRYSRLEELDPKIIVKPIEEAFYSYSFFFKNLLTRWLEKEKDPFALLAFVLQKDAPFIYVPNEVVQKKPLTLVQIGDQDERKAFSSFQIFSLGKKSSLSMHHLTCDQNKSSCLDLSLQLVQVEEDSSFNMAMLSETCSHPCLKALRVYQKKNSNFDFTSLALGSKKSRMDCYIQLLERNCRASISSISALKNQEEAHLNVLVEHHDEESVSYQRVKNLYDGKSMGSFEGKIYVHPKAQKTNAYQLNQNCLLSDQAVSYSKPNLEIFADDVKASHGSTTGQMDSEQLLYLRSRGLSKAYAKKLLLAAFCDEVLNQLQDQAMKKKFKKALDSYFEGQ